MADGASDPKLCRTRAWRIYRTTIGKIAFDADLRGDCEELVGDFSYRFPLHVMDQGPPHPLTAIPTAGVEASEVVA